MKLNITIEKGNYGMFVATAFVVQAGEEFLKTMCFDGYSRSEIVAAFKASMKAKGEQAALI